MKSITIIDNTKALVARSVTWTRTHSRKWIGNGTNHTSRIIHLKDSSQITCKRQHENHNQEAQHHRSSDGSLIFLAPVKSGAVSCTCLSASRKSSKYRMN